MIELLSPAGNMESLKAAIEAGCDAVYLGGTLFGARAFANNFNNEEIVEAINYAHLYGVKVYVTTNILIYEHEVEHFLNYVEFLHKNNVDAIIIQDLGMLDLVHKTFPNLEIHASTQMHIHNLDGVIMAQKLGVKRVVLARETPIEVIEEINKKVSVDLEIFAHGALCVSYSGQCLFSSLIGNRSGNRGSCVGSCRLQYNILDENKKILSKGEYPISMKDLNTLEYVGNLISAGVRSLKIEGRMKSPEYVYTVTKLYREAIDSYYKDGKVSINQQELHNLQKIFSRGYTKGYLFHEKMENILNIKRPNHQGIVLGRVIQYQNNFVSVKLFNDVAIDDGDYGLILNQFYKNKNLVKEAKKGDIISFKVNKRIPLDSQVLLTKDSSLSEDILRIIQEKRRKVLINGEVILKLNEPMQIKIDDGKNFVSVTSDIINSSINNPTKKETIYEKLNKLGNTIYQFKKLDIKIDNDVFVPLKLLNELRIKAVSLLNEKRLYKYEFIKEEYSISLPNFKKEQKRSVLVNNLDSVNKNAYDIIYSENKNDDTIIKIPKIVDDYSNYDNTKEYLVGELGAFNKLSNVNCDYSFNVCNSYTVALLHSLGAKRVTLSYEMNEKQIVNLINAYYQIYCKRPNLELVVEGYLEAMTLKTNLNKIYDSSIIYLEDGYKNLYKIIEKDGLSYIYDFKKRKIYDEKYYDLGINTLRFNKESF